MVINLGGDKRIVIDAWELSKIISVITTLTVTIAEAKSKSNKDS